MRCTGTKTATNEPCGSLVFRCRACEHTGCNQGGESACTQQAFRAARCRQCGKLGQNRIVKDEAAAQSADAS